ncbi:MAG: hypothetical protein PHI59_06690, partial [Candidatus Omnitrophica bacterium]|nr:hypothetical protein [Candidatus Omnitrophota bacterium]
MHNDVINAAEMRAATLKQIPEGWDEMVGDCDWGTFYHSSLNLELLGDVSPSMINFITYHEKNLLAGGIAYG